MLDAEQRMEAALKPFGWGCSGVFWQRYYSDPWVFNLANAVLRLSERVGSETTESSAKADPASDPLGPESP